MQTILSAMCTRYFLAFIICTSSLFSCTTGKKAYSPYRKYPKEALQKDYILLREALEAKHPSLYWYQDKDSIDAFFDRQYLRIGDSMTEQAFAWHIISPLLRQFHCGHTTVGLSKSYSKWAYGKTFSSFPLYLKVWNDSMAVIGNLNRKDSLMTRGTLVTGINGSRNKELIRRMFSYLPTDGFSESINYTRLSSNFPYFHRNIFGLSKTYRVNYIDSAGREKEAILPMFEIKKDSSKEKTAKQKPTKPPRKKIPRAERLTVYRSFEIDSSKQFAVMTVNTFTRGNLRTFFRRSFRTMRKKKIPSLVIDLRSNGGGHVALSTLLTRYVTRERFGVADSIYAVSKDLGRYTKYFRGGWLNNLEMWLIAARRKDGKYHVPYLEKKKFSPKKSNHYNGHVYVLTSGSTFSASSLFCNAVKGQEGIWLVGEETGGGWHGNSGIMIPQFQLPNTGIRVRFPLYRLVQYRHVPKNGSGVMPDIPVETDYRFLLERKDKKMEVARQLILQQQEKQDSVPSNP